MEVILSTPPEFATYMTKEQEFWGKIIRDNNLKPE